MSLVELNAELLGCKKCSRLVAWREQVSREKRRQYAAEEYWGRPVPGFGDPQASVFVVGLAPGAHGSNRTGRQFTGDASGDFLFPALYRAGFASQPYSTSRYDGMLLKDLYTSPICRCVPPQNKPSPREIRNCLPYLYREFEIIKPKILVALGRIAFDNIKVVVPGFRPEQEFKHGSVWTSSTGHVLVCSYHPSRQNTQTGRLTVAMFDEIWTSVRRLLM